MELPSHDLRAPFADTEGGDRLIAGRHAIFVERDGKIVDAGMWYEVQYAHWNHETRKLVVVWVEPDRPGITRITADKEPKKFLKRMTYSVDRTIIGSRSVTLPSGTTLTATARRRADGEIFTTVLARGEVLPRDENVADALEQQLLKELNVR